MELIEKDLSRIKDLLASSLENDIKLLSDTNDEILANEGKMLRPKLAVLLARAAGEISDDTYCFAAASEVIHNSSLLHDDVVDQATMRRGHPTVEAILGTRPAVLLGDFWVAIALKLIMSSEQYSRKALLLFSEAISYLAEGEFLQLELSRTGGTTEEDYYRIIFSKTAALFVATAKAAVLSVGASPEKIEAAGTFARCIGLAFQIKDDIMDYSDADIGKPVGQDIREKKITLPLLGAMALHPDREAWVREAVSQGRNHDKIISFVRNEGGIGYATRKMDELIAEAKNALGVFGDSPEKDYLAEIASYIAERKY